MGSYWNYFSHFCKRDDNSSEKNNNWIKIIKPKTVDNNFYDISIKINNIKDITEEGWKIELKEKIELKNNLIKLGILGETNKGKTSILQKLLDIKIDNDIIIKTKGLGIKYNKDPNIEINNNNNYIILDCEGMEKPILDNEKQEEDLIINNKIQLNDIENLIKEKLLKELFFQHFIIKYSDIPILVVDELNFSEQKLLSKIQNILKTNDAPKKLFVVHNLKNYINIEEVKNYIDETLFKLAGIKLIKREFVTTNIINVNVGLNANEEQKNYIYYEQKLDNETYNIIHLIMANEFSEAGNYYNDFAIKYLKNHINQFTDLPNFSFQDKLIENLIELSKSMLNENIDKSKFNINSTEEKIIITYDGEITYKKHLDYLLQTFNLYNNDIIPEYRYYINNNQFIIELEIAGKTKDIECEYILKNGYYHFNLTGKKIEDLVNNNNLEIKNYYSSNKNKTFKLNLVISSDNLMLKSDDYNFEDLGNGILSFKFELYNKPKNKKIYE